MSLVNIVVLTLVSVVVLLLLFQHKLIYFPREYERGFYDHNLRTGVEEISYETPQGRQLGFYLPPKTGESTALPEELWVVHGGNGSLALEWVEILAEYPGAGSGFLLVDYPSYGRSAGRAHPETILESSRAALETLIRKKGWVAEQAHKRLHILGHSLGAAAGLQFAVHYPVERVVLIAPFTSTMAMARRQVGYPLSLLLRHKFDNVARLQELLGRDEPPEIFLIHGTEDPVIPVRMSRELAELDAERVHLIEVPGADHNWIIGDASPLIFRNMQGKP